MTDPDRRRQAWTLIANPAAGGGRGARVAERGRRRLLQAGMEVSLDWTSRRGQARELAAAARDRGSAVVVVCGGDGTVAEVLPVLAGGETSLGLLPAGTCNDLARALGIGISEDPAMRVLLEGQPRPIDLGRCGDRLFATVASFGFDAEVGEEMAEGRSPLPGTAGYLYTALRRLRGYRPAPVCLRGEFGVREQEVFLLAMGNTPSYGAACASARKPTRRTDGSISAWWTAASPPARCSPWFPGSSAAGTWALPRCRCCAPPGWRSRLSTVVPCPCAPTASVCARPRPLCAPSTTPSG